MSREKKGAGESHTGYDLFASITAFKAKLESLYDLDDPDEVGTLKTYSKSNFLYDEAGWEISTGNSTMAIGHRNSRDEGVRIIVS